MQVAIIELEVEDERLVDELIALKNDVVRADAPDRPLLNARSFRNNLRRVRPWYTTERRVAMVEDRAVGYLQLGLPLTANTHVAQLELLVHPGYRRQQIGSELMRQAYLLAARHKRRTLNASALRTWEDGPARPEAGDLFLRREGFDPALTEVIRTLDFSAMDLAAEQRLVAETERASADYRIVSFAEWTPDDLIASAAELSSIFLSEAPLGELELEPDPITAERIRDAEQSAIEDGVLSLGTLAVDQQGTVVAITEIRVSERPGDWANQEITLVHPQHRGHRLGLRVKLENQRQLRSQRPDVETIVTGNAAANEHMIGINQTLGFRPLDAHQEYQRQL